MKTLTIFLLSFLLVQNSEGQLLKKIGQRVKEEAEWKAKVKTDNQIDKGLDTLIALPKKIIDKKKDKNKNNHQAKVTDSPANSDNKKGDKKNETPQDESNDMTPKDGLVTLNLSSTSVFVGGRITISGESVKYKNFNQVEISVTGPSTKDIKPVTLTNDGKFNSIWIADDKTGTFTVSVNSSDKKQQQSAKFTVYALPQLNSWADENVDETNKAYDNLKEAVEKVKDGISPNDKETLEKKMTGVKDKVDDALKLFKDLNTAGKQTADLLKTAKNISPNLSGNLSALNDALADNAIKLKSFRNLTKHKPQDNTICEYCVMVNEACAAFSTFTNFWAKSLRAVATNIALDKGVPKVVDVVNTNTTQVSAPNDFFPKEIAKIYATVQHDASAFSTKLGKAGLAGDVLQYASDVVLKHYCGTYSGEVKHDYTIKFRNKDGVIWWEYGVSMQAALSLRYPKEGSKGNSIKMKGNIEGNATKFTFYENVEQEDGFKEGSKGKIKVIALQEIKPAALPFVTSQNDAAGFGAAARFAVTPAYFNITVDAEYDVDAKKIKIFLNHALTDFSTLVANQLVFVEIGPSMLPYIKHMTFPIHPAFRTMGAVVRSHNEFDMKKDAKGNLTFSGKVNKHIGEKTDKIEHDLNFSISATKQ
jgi:predicted transcriptional regulator